MRPQILNPLFQPISRLKGVGPKTLPLIEKAIGGELVRDAAFHLPFRVIDRRHNCKIADALNGQMANYVVTVDAHEEAYKNRPYRVLVSDETGFLNLVFFNPNPRYLKARLPIGAHRIISGEVTERFYEKQINHPSRILDLGDSAANVAFEAVYGNTAGLSQKLLASTCKQAAAMTINYPEWLDNGIVTRHKWPDFHSALMELHNPETEEALKINSLAHQRLAYDELLARQLILAQAYKERAALKRMPLRFENEWQNQFINSLPYEPTNAQLRAFSDLVKDFCAELPMSRLLQGDVGAGKTLVAAFGAFVCAKNGLQTALMAPTEVLARQHLNNVKSILEPLGIETIALTGRDKGKTRTEILEQIKNGAAQLIIGTHALFQDLVEFPNLGFVIVDEQHRFGVNARRALKQKGQMTHVLNMSATPIPRTLAIANYGDMDMSILDEKPKNRKPIQTLAFDLKRIEEVISSIGRAIKNDDRVYWVCPLVEESEVLDLTAVNDRFADLKKCFGSKVEIIHGQMPNAQKDLALSRFQSGEARILVATSVIEVGIDVKEASIMVIEHAERFGLAQLHQLRGRVGRGDRQSFCFLLYKSPLGENAKTRIEALRETNDGFLIAEKDFELRGAGDMLGLKQTGLPEFKFADLALHRELFQMARDEARLIALNENTERAEKLEVLLHLFDAPVRVITE